MGDGKVEKTLNWAQERPGVQLPGLVSGTWESEAVLWHRCGQRSSEQP
jgi:hypothetical protein